MRPEKVDRVRKKRIKAEAEDANNEAIKSEAVKTEDVKSEELGEMYGESDSSATEEFEIATLHTTELITMEPLEPTQVHVILVVSMCLFLC